MAFLPSAQKRARVGVFVRSVREISVTLDGQKMASRRGLPGCPMDGKNKDKKNIFLAFSRSGQTRDAVSPLDMHTWNPVIAITRHCSIRVLGFR